ncbi:TPA: hypothetical protein N0F65_003215, partial [Lagenidium giganteum]
VPSHRRTQTRAHFVETEPVITSARDIDRSPRWPHASTSMSSEQSTAAGARSPLPPPPPSSPPPVSPVAVTVVGADGPNPYEIAKSPTINLKQAAEHLFPALFEYTQPCESIGITGSFNNWGSQIMLERKEGVGADGKPMPFSVMLHLPLGTHFFKYCVDGAWKYDPEVVFAPDEYGNLNNVIKISAEYDELSNKVINRPIRTILRDNANGYPMMNPAAKEELARLRSQHSPVMKGCRSPSRPDRTHKAMSEPTPMILPLREPQETQDSEYGLDPDQLHHHHVAHGGRSRAGTLTRSKSEESLSVASSVEEMGPMRKYSQYVQDVVSSSVLLAATTQHFGGDLVTQEHSTRAQQGGHRSSITFPQGEQKARRGGKLIIFLVGLPGRGKTFIGHILARHMTWMGHQSKVFNTGEYRRLLVGASVNHAFWDPNNEESYKKREEIAKQCLEDALQAMETDACDCVIFDATNATRERRQMLRETVLRRYKCEMLYIESVCESPEIIASAINEMKLNSADYAAQTLEEAAQDYSSRIQHYLAVYEPLLSEKEDVPFIKVIDVGRQIFCNQVYGYLQSRIMFLMANLQLKPRPIWLSRHGESMYNTQKRIGGDAPLSPLGMQYAVQLDRFINTYYPAPDTDLVVWTSTMLRTGMTVERIAARGRPIVKWKQLDEIDAGVCDGLTYEQVAEEMPEEYLARKNNKLHYRYPRGESYQDVIHRLEPVITELMRMDQPVLIVAHQAILRVLYAYLTNKSPSECPTLNIPLHVVIQVTPKAYQCEEVWHRPM